MSSSSMDSSASLSAHPGLPGHGVTDVIGEASGSLLSAAATACAQTTSPEGLQREWLEADGLGGFASGTVSGARSRRYHALLLSASLPPTGRLVLVNGFEAWIEGPEGVTPLTTQRYAPDVVYPTGWQRITDFTSQPWPTWRFSLGWPATPTDALTHEVFGAGDGGDIVLRWRLNEIEGVANHLHHGRKLYVRPLLSVRDYHALHKENAGFDFGFQGIAGRISWRPYADRPGVSALTNGTYQHGPEWFRQFLYADERERGMDDTEDLASPGVFVFDLSKGPALMILRAGDSRDVRVTERVQQVEAQQRALRKPYAPAAHGDTDTDSEVDADADAVAEADAAANAKAAMTADRSASLLHDLRLAAASYFVERGRGATIVAGYPWFTDWGRDTFISLRGLTLHTGRHDLAAAILHEWARCVSDGMLPNRFTDSGETPEYNSVDASLWFIVALHAYLQTDHAAHAGDASRAALQDAANQILIGYSKGTRFAIGMRPDGLLHAGVAGSQLTWMDARVDGRAATPRIGKPVEIQALWINALRIASAWRPQWASFADRAQAAFTQRFVNPAAVAAVSLAHQSDDNPKPETGILFDVVDVDGCDDVLDDSLRPNQIFAAGGLPFRVVDAALAAKIVNQVERTLLTPMGLRTLATDDPRYIGQYIGPPEVRDEAYHQGTVWPWLMGGFVEAWLFVHAGPDASPETRALARRQARERFLAPLDAHLAQAGIGHISEIADGDAPHTPRGAPFQAWSLAERIRIESLLTDPEQT